MKPLTFILIALLLAGCATVQHPLTPGVQYASMDECRAQNPDSADACTKVMHAGATWLVLDTIFKVMLIGLLAVSVARH